MTSFRILIVDDHEPTRKQMIAYLNEQTEVSLVMEAKNGLVALQMLHEIPFDIVVTDVIMPQMDGFTLMNRMKEMSLASAPAVFVMSSLNRGDLITQATNLGAQFFFIKPFAPENLFFHIQNLACPKPASTPSHATDQMIEERISNLFMSIGIPPHLKGYQYLREAIKLVIDDHSRIDSITKRLYPEVANSLSTATSKVERAMRHAIGVAWNRGRVEPLNEAFGYKVYITDDRPSNGEFIALIADKISLEISAHQL